MDLSKILSEEFLPATLTFIVGILGVCAQLTINFLSERGKRKMDVNSIRRKNIVQFYIPLLQLLRQYKYIQELLLLNNEFSIANWNYPNQEETKKRFEEFRQLYVEVLKLSSGNYIPTEKQLDKEIQAFTNHITLTRILWDSRSNSDEFSKLLPTEQLKGYNTEQLMKLLSKEINRCR